LLDPILFDWSSELIFDWSPELMPVLADECSVFEAEPLISLAAAELWSWVLAAGEF
jgi:hypothetical protein